MKPVEYLVNRLKEVLTEGKWVTGTNFKEQISDLDWKDAIKKIDDLNTIAEITFHIHYYIAGVTQVLEGGSLDIKDRFSFDSPPIKSQQDWRNLVDLFCSDSEKFISLVENMTDEKLKSDLENRTGLNVNKVTIGDVDFLKDTANVTIFYFKGN